MANESPRPTPADDPDPLDALSERLHAAQAAAERLVREATEAAEAAAAADPPPGGPGGPAGGASGPEPGGPPPPGGGASGSGSSRRPPPRGYATPGSGEARVQSAEAQALAALIELGRTIVPPDLRRQLADLIRELLLLVRAVIDWYLERLESGRPTATEVEDIPIS
jgi:hypothetical protein